MDVIDTSQWKEFRIGDLFDIVPTKGKNTYCLEDGSDLPYIAASRENNGVNRMISKDSVTDIVSSGNCLVFIHIGDAAAGYCHYIKSDFVGMAGKTSCAYLKNHTMTENIGLFFASIIRQTNEGRYSFGESWTGKRLLDTMIFLPSTPSGDPDWDYMDSFMGEILEKEESSVKQLAALAPESEADGHFLDVSGWKAFHLYDIFHIDMGNKFDRSKMPIDDEINFVGRTGLNNGINATCGAVDKVEPYPPGLITLALGGTIGACFVQPKKFYTSQNVIVLNPKQKLSFAVKTFISAIIWRVSDMYYDAFSNELNRHIKTDFVFWLPVTSDGQPDWAWMEQYMQQQLDKTEKLAEHLNELN